jgi:glycosyltransferase involved in cell wall biosynthesis
MRHACPLPLSSQPPATGPASLKIHLLIPAHNAAGTLEDVIVRIPPGARSRIARCIVVNDGSIDGTEAVLNRLMEDLPDMVRLRHPSSHGHGAACKTLLGCALRLGADAAVFINADGRQPPEMLPDLFDSLEQRGTDVIQVSRVSNRAEAAKAFSGTAIWAYSMLNAIERSAFQVKLDDFHSGYCAYTRRAMETVQYQDLSDSEAFSLEFLLMAVKAGLPIKEISAPANFLKDITPLHPLSCAADSFRLRYSRSGKSRA